MNGEVFNNINAFLKMASDVFFITKAEDIAIRTHNVVTILVMENIVQFNHTS